MKFLPPFLFQKIEVYDALIHNFRILSSGLAPKIIFLSLQSWQKMHYGPFPKPGTCEVIRCVNFDRFTLSQCMSHKFSSYQAMFLAVIFTVEKVLR